MGDFAYPPVNFETHPDRYVHWDLEVDGSVAKLTMHIKEDRPMWDGLYDLKLNSYDLAVDIERDAESERVTARFLQLSRQMNSLQSALTTTAAELQELKKQEKADIVALRKEMK